MVEGSGTRRERPDRTEPDQEARECFRMIILSRDRDEASVRFRIEEGTGRRVELPDRTEFDREARESFNRMISTLSQDGVLPQDRDEAYARFGREMRVRPTLLHNVEPLRRLTARQRIHAFISVVVASPWRFASHTSLYTRAFLFSLENDLGIDKTAFRGPVEGRASAPVAKTVEEYSRVSY